MKNYNFSEKFKNMIDNTLPKEYPKERPINVTVKRIHEKGDFVDLFCEEDI